MMDMDDRPASPTASRRGFLSGAVGVTGALALAPTLTLRPAQATPASMAAAIRDVVGEATVREGKVKLEIPPLVENGNAVSLTVSVESPMTEADHVKAIHIFNEKNPQPNVISLHFGPRAGRAVVSTRVRLADTQNVIAIAELNDGSFWSTTVQVIVTLAACLEDP